MNVYRGILMGLMAQSMMSVMQWSVTIRHIIVYPAEVLPGHKFHQSSIGG
jgi:hypothetical protein